MRVNRSRSVAAVTVLSLSMQAALPAWAMAAVPVSGTSTAPSPPSPALSAEAAPATPSVALTTDDIKAVRQVCEQGGEFHEQAPVVTEQKRGMLDCLALYKAMNLPIPTRKPAVAPASRMNLDSCLPPDPVESLLPKINDEDTFGKLGSEQDEEACRKAAEANRGSLLGDLGCMVVRDILRGAAAVPAASWGATSAAAAAGAGTTFAAGAAGGAAAGVASGTVLGDGLLGVGEWIANKIKPDQACVTTKKSSCISAAIAGVVNNLIFNIKGIWDLIKLPFKAIGSLFSSTTGVEDAMADKKLDASGASAEESQSFFSDPSAWLSAKVAQIWAGIVHEVTHNYGCQEWSGSATAGQIGGTCVKPWVCFEAASIDQILSVACGVAGFIGGEALSAYLTVGVATLAGKGVELGGLAIKATKFKPLIAGTEAATAAAVKVGEKIAGGVGVIANLPGVNLALSLAISPLKFPIIKQYISFVGHAGEAGGAAAGRMIGKVAATETAASLGAKLTARADEYEKMAETAAARASVAEAAPVAAAPAVAPAAAVAPVDAAAVKPAWKLVGREMVAEFPAGAGSAVELQAKQMEAEVKAILAEADRLRLEYMMYGSRARNWDHLQGFAANRAADRAQKLEKLSGRLGRVVGSETDLLAIRAKASIEAAVKELKGLNEFKPGKTIVGLRTLNPELDKQILRLQREHEKIVADLGAYRPEGKEKFLKEWNEKWANRAKIEAEIDAALGAEGAFTEYNVERYHKELGLRANDPDLLAELANSGRAAVRAQEDMLERMSKFLNATLKDQSFVIQGEKGARQIQLVDRATGVVVGEPFKLKEAAEAAKVCR